MKRGTHMNKKWLAVPVIGLSLTAAACGSSTHGATKSQAAPTPPKATAAPTPPTTAAADLQARLIPAPFGYQASTSNPGGPETPALFDHDTGAGNAQSLGFVFGYNQGYDSTLSNESVNVALAKFTTPNGPTMLMQNITQGVLGGAASLSPTRSTMASIPGSIVLTSTKAGTDGFWVSDVFAQKGKYLMMVEYANDSAIGSLPSALTQAALNQYSRL
jgi:hypothetical protein